MNLDYDLLIAESAPPRREVLNVGLVLWRDGLPQIVADISAQRLAALDPNYPKLPVFKVLLNGALSAHLRQHLAALAGQPGARSLLDLLISPMKAVSGGVMFAEDGDFAAHIERALDTLVRRPALTIKTARTKAATPSALETQLKAWFRAAKIMGRSMEDLSKHRIVSQFPISVDANVYADFAYKNGTLHVIETLDLRGLDHVTSSVRNKAAFKSLTLDMARDVVTSTGRRIGVVAASDYAAIKSALRLFERNADDLFSVDSPEDTQRLADLLAHSLHLESGLLAAEGLQTA